MIANMTATIGSSAARNAIPINGDSVEIHFVTAYLRCRWTILHSLLHKCPRFIDQLSRHSQFTLSLYLMPGTSRFSIPQGHISRRIEQMPTAPFETQSRFV